MRNRGFSLIELLIVVAIILVLAAIAIPNLLRSKVPANEASAIASMRQVNTAQGAYIVAYPNVGYADTLTKLAHPAPGTAVSATAAGLIDWVLGCAAQPCNKSGYNFSIENAAGTPVNTYDIFGVPQVLGQTGYRGFCSDHSQAVKFDPNGAKACTGLIE